MMLALYMYMCMIVFLHVYLFAAFFARGWHTQVCTRFILFRGGCLGPARRHLNAVAPDRQWLPTGMAKPITRKGLRVMFRVLRIRACGLYPIMNRPLGEMVGGGYNSFRGQARCNAWYRTLQRGPHCLVHPSSCLVKRVTSRGKTKLALDCSRHGLKTNARVTHAVRINSSGLTLDCIHGDGSTHL